MKLTDNRRWKASAHIVMIIMSFLAVVPFVLLLVSSITDENTAITNGYSFLTGKTFPGSL